MEEEYAWPLDADGIEIKPGDKIYFSDDPESEAFKCIAVGLSPLPVKFIDWEGTGTSAYEDGSTFTHRSPKPSAVLVGDVATFESAKPDKAQALKVLEEAAEVYAAWQAWDGEQRMHGMNIVLRDFEGDVLDEIADVIQAACNLAAALGATDFRSCMEECRIRNYERGRYGSTEAE